MKEREEKRMKEYKREKEGRRKKGKEREREFLIPYMIVTVEIRPCQ